MSRLLRLTGWTGSALFALCALPQAITSVTTGSTAGLSSWFLGMWFTGEVLSLVYVLKTVPLRTAAPLLTNYTFNLVCLLVILAVHLRGGV